MDTRYHYVRELVGDGIIEVEFVKSAENDADPFTKNTKQETFQDHSRKWMLLNPELVNREDVKKYSQSRTDGQSTNISDKYGG